MEPRVSIIIPVKNVERTLNIMFEALLAVNYPKDKMELILADGGSADQTISIIKDWQKKYSFIKLTEVRNSRSPGEARNQALKLVTGEYVLFTDGDCAVEKDWIHHLLEPFASDPKIGAVGGEILTLRLEEDNLTESYCEQVHFLEVAGRAGVKASGYMPNIKRYLPSKVDGDIHSPFFATANVAYPKRIIDEMSGEFWHYPTGEDVDFSIRIQKAGYKLYFRKEAVVKHMHRTDLKSYKKQWWGYGYGHPLLVLKHAEPVLEVILQFPKDMRFTISSKKPGIIRIGNFHLMHFLGLTSLIALPISSAALTFFGLLFLLATAIYFWPCLKIKPLKYLPTWCKIRYLTNLSFILGALKGSREFKALCIEASW